MSESASTPEPRGVAMATNSGSDDLRHPNRCGAAILTQETDENEAAGNDPIGTATETATDDTDAMASDAILALLSAKEFEKTTNETPKQSPYATVENIRTKSPHESTLACGDNTSEGK